MPIGPRVSHLTQNTACPSLQAAALPRGLRAPCPAEYTTLERAVAEAGEAVADAAWTSFDGPRRTTLVLRRSNFERRARRRARRSEAAFAKFITAADKAMRDNLLGDITVWTYTVDSTETRWSNDVCYVRIMKGHNFTAHITYGPLDMSCGPALGPDEHFETYEINLDSAREVGLSVLADWLNSNELNDAGFPVYQPRVTP